jgi:hypothetical protein
VIAILDSRTYEEDLTGAARIEIPARKRLLIAAGDWPEEPVPDTPGATRRVTGHLLPEHVRPHLIGDVAVVGTAGEEDEPGTLILNGLLVEGRVTVLGGSLGGLELAHCTVVPDAKAITVRAGAGREKRNSRLGLSLDHSICGAITCPPSVAAVRIGNSIVSSGMERDDARTVLAAAGAEVSVDSSTILGGVSARTLHGSNSIFTGRADAVRRQEGCVRFSFLPLESSAPRRYRCQPDLEASARIEEAERRTGAGLSAAERAAIQLGTVAEVRPVFTASRYGAPAFLQLAARCPIQLRTGADDEAEMGAFHELYQPQREANLRVRLDEYLRVGLEAGVFYVS